MGNHDALRVADTRRFDLVHVRELEQLLMHGQSNSRVGLIDLAGGTVLCVGHGADAPKQIDDKMFSTFGRAIFTPSRGPDPRRDQLRDFISANGGVSAIAVMMLKHTLFIGRLPGTARAFSLVVRHDSNSVSASDTVVHAAGWWCRLWKI